MKELEGDIEKITEQDIENYKSLPYSQTFTEPIRNKYYNMSDDRRMYLAKNYGIDYFIMAKSRMKNLSAMPVAFENKHFMVLEAKLDPNFIVTWETVLDSDFEEALPTKPETTGWSTYSSGRPITWPWGLTSDSYMEKYAIYLKQPTLGNEFWLHTGEGPIDKPVGGFGGVVLRIDSE